jgi:hypothetical protein
MITEKMADARFSRMQFGHQREIVSEKIPICKKNFKVKIP